VEAGEAYALRIGGVVVGLSAVSSPLRLEPSPSARPFLVTGETPDSRFAVGWRELDAVPPGDLVFDSGGSWRLYRRGGRDVYRFFDSRLGAIPYKEAEVEADGREGWIWLDPRFHPGDEAVDPLQFPLDELIFLRLLGARDALELHACGVVTASGVGLVFAGQSGDGKTTTARLWEREAGATVLRDDRVVVRRGDLGDFWIYGTPWHGEAEIAESRRAPLAAVLVLARGERNTLERLGAAQGLSLLLARSFPPFHDAGRMAETLRLLEALVLSVPCRRFSFVPGPGAVREVLELEGLFLDDRARPGLQ
jgi:hypothetical protein